MKRLILLGLFFLLGYQEILSQTWRRIGNWGNPFTDIQWISEDIGYIAGENLILKTIDGGLSWVEQEAPTTDLMLALDFFDQQNGMIVGQNGTVFRTANGGDRWEPVNIGSNSHLTSVKYLTDSKIWIAGEQGAFYQSLDGGMTWVAASIPSTADLNAIFAANSDSVYVVTSDSRILKTENGGNTWTAIPTEFERSIHDIYFVNDSVGYAVGELGTIIKTEDAGNTWNFINSGMDIRFNKVQFSQFNPLMGVIIGNNGTVLRTLNGGLTFVAVASRTGQNMNGIGFKPNSNVVFATSNSGVLTSSNNAGGSWSLRLSGRDNDYTGVQFLTDLRGYIIGQNGLILLTANGGNSFSDRTRPLSLPFNALYFVSGSQGYVSGNNGNIISTTNSGGAWSALNPGTNRDVNGMHFFDINTGYVVGSRGFISKTENRGVNWINIAPGNGDVDYRDIRFFDSEVGIIVGDGGWVSRSVGGTVWERVVLSSSENLHAIEILDENTAIITGENGAIFKTEDKGLIWRKIPVDFNQNLKGIAFLDESVGFVAGDKGLMLRTMDAGETWTRVLTGTFQNFTGISFGDLNTGYAVGDNGTFFSYTCAVPERPATIFGEDNICLSQQIYSIQGTAEPDVTYEWRIDGGTILEGQGSTRVVIDWDTPGRNAIMVRGQNNCGNGSISALEVVVSTSPDQLGEIQGEGLACLNTVLEYQVDSVPGTEYSWQVTGGLVRSGQGTAAITVEWTGLGEHSLKVSSQNPCGSGPMSEKAVRIQTVPDRPSAIEGPEMAGPEEAGYEINALPGINYQWTAGDGGRIVDGQGTGRVTVKWEKEGDHVLQVTPMNECDNGQSRELHVNVNVITSIREESRSGELKIYPIPSSGDIKINARGIPEIIEINIYNVLGQNIYQYRPVAGVMDLEIQRLPKGVHTLILKSRNKEYVKMILIQ